MEPKIKAAFDQIHADPQLKESTRRYVFEQMEKRQSKRPQWRMAYAVAVCAIMVFAFVGGYRLYFTPTSIISIDVNPSIELDINRFNKVIAVEGYNQDGIDFAQTLNILYMDYNEAVDQIMESETITQCLSRDEMLSVAVVEIDAVQGAEILNYVTESTAHQENTFCYGMDSDDVELAHSLGLSCGKYNIYVEIQEYDTDLTPEEANSMTMRQLRDLLAQLQSGTEETSQTEGSGEPQGNGSGTGNGNGMGSGNGSGTGNGNGMGSGNGAGAGNGSGMGSGNGSGAGNGSSTGSGNGFGAGNGSGTGSGNGSGAGNGNGMGSGNGAGAGNGSGAGHGKGMGAGKGC